MKSIKTIKDYVFAFCKNGATKASIEKIALDETECWTMVFKDEKGNVYGAFNIKELRTSELEILLDAIVEKRLSASIESKM